MKKVLVVGELNVDLIVGGMTEFPAPGKEVLARDFVFALGGSSALCATGLARLGATISFVGKVGADHYGDFAIEQLRGSGVDTAHIARDNTFPTGVTLSLTFSGDRALVTYPGCISELGLQDIDLSILPGYCHLHVGSLFLQKRLRGGLCELFKQAHRQNLTISLDPGSDPKGEWGGEPLWELLGHVDIFLPSETEARAIAGRQDTPSAVRRLSERARCVVVKCGAAGALALVNGEIITSDGFPVEVVDTTGAGDAFDAGFIYASVIQERPLREALRFANACGALSATGLGGMGSQPCRDQVHQWFRYQDVAPSA